MAASGRPIPEIRLGIVAATVRRQASRIDSGMQVTRLVARALLSARPGLRRQSKKSGALQFRRPHC